MYRANEKLKIESITHRASTIRNVGIRPVVVEHKGQRTLIRGSDILDFAIADQCTHVEVDLYNDLTDQQFEALFIKPL